MNCEAEKQTWYYDRAMSTAQLVPGDVVLMKNDMYQGKWKVKDRWSETEYVVVCQVTEGTSDYDVVLDSCSEFSCYRKMVFTLLISETEGTSDYDVVLDSCSEFSCYRKMVFTLLISETHRLQCDKN